LYDDNKDPGPMQREVEFTIKCTWCVVKKEEPAPVVKRDFANELKNKVDNITSEVKVKKVKVIKIPAQPKIGKVSNDGRMKITFSKPMNYPQSWIDKFNS